MVQKKEKYVEILNNLINEGNQVVATQFEVSIIGAPTYVDVQSLNRWFGKIKSLYYQLGKSAEPWKKILSEDPKQNTLFFTKQVIGTLEAIKFEIENDHLDSFTRIIRAETAADLMEQAELLLTNGFYLAAGVIGRAILEEILRKTCESLSCSPTKEKPTINDYNQSLYANQHYSKTRMKQIEALAAIGNDAAHNSPNLSKDDVKRLINELPELIEGVLV